MRYELQHLGTGFVAGAALVILLVLVGQLKLVLAIGGFALALLNVLWAILQLLNRLGSGSGQS